MQENNTTFIYLKGIITDINNDICRAKAILEDSRVISFRYRTYKSNHLTRSPKINEKIIVLISR